MGGLKKGSSGPLRSWDVDMLLKMHLGIWIPFKRKLFLLLTVQMNIEWVAHSEIFYLKFWVQTKLTHYNSFLLEKMYFLSEFKVTINLLKSKFYLNLAFYISAKLNPSFVRIYYKKKIFIGITPFKTIKTCARFFATLQYFLELIIPIKKCKWNIFHPDRYENSFLPSFRNCKMNVLLFKL